MLRAPIWMQSPYFATASMPCSSIASVTMFSPNSSRTSASILSPSTPKTLKSIRRRSRLKSSAAKEFGTALCDHLGGREDLPLVLESARSRDDRKLVAADRAVPDLNDGFLRPEVS